MVGDPATLRKHTLARYASGLDPHDPALFARVLMNGFVGNVYRWANRQERTMLLSSEPALKGVPGFDVYVAAIADYLATRDDLEAPVWVNGADRVPLEHEFFPGDQRLTLMRPRARENTPERFAYHNIWIDKRNIPSFEVNTTFLELGLNFEGPR